VLNNVPRHGLFWIIKLLGATIGETAADYLSTTLHLAWS
jgi:uncharacterized membrane-anchored protein